MEKPAPVFAAPDAFNGWALSVVNGSPAHSANFRTEEPYAGMSKGRELSPGRDPAAWVIQQIAFTDPGLMPDHFDPVDEWDPTGLLSDNDSPASET